MALKQTAFALTAIALVTVLDASAGRSELAYPKAAKTMAAALSRQDFYMEGVVLALATMYLSTPRPDAQQKGNCIIDRYFAKDLTGGIVTALSAEELLRKSAVVQTLLYFKTECGKPAEAAAQRAPTAVIPSDAELLSIFEGVIDTIGILEGKHEQESKCVLDLNYGPQNARSAFLTAARAKPEESPVVLAFEAIKPCGSTLDSNAFAAPVRNLDLRAAGAMRYARYDFEITLRVAREAAKEVLDEEKKKQEELKNKLDELDANAWVDPTGRKVYKGEAPDEWYYADGTLVPLELVSKLSPP
jgi:hypothetical protein